MLVSAASHSVGSAHSVKVGASLVDTTHMQRHRRCLSKAEMPVHTHLRGCCIASIVSGKMLWWSRMENKTADKEGDGEVTSTSLSNPKQMPGGQLPES